MKHPRTTWAIRVTYPNGEDAFLRRGSIVGEGAIVKFRTRKDAEINIEMITPGLDEGCVVAVVALDSRL